MSLARKPRLTLALVLLSMALLWGCRRDEAPPAPSAATPTAATTETPPAEPPAAEAVEAAVAPSEPPVAAPEPTPEPARVIIDRLRVGEARSLTASRGGQYALAVVAPDVVQVFDASMGRLIVERRLAPAVLCRTRPFTPDGSRALVRQQGEVRLVNLGTGKTLQTFEGGRGVRCTLTSDGLRAVLATAETVRVVDLQGNPVASHPVKGFDRVERVIADGRGDNLVLVGRQGGRTLARAFGGQGGRLWRELAGYTDGELVMNTSGERVAGAAGATRTRVWETWTGRQVAEYAGGLPLRFLNNDTQLAIGHGQGRLDRVDLETGEVVDSLTTRDGVQVMDVTEDGLRVLVASLADGQHHLGHWSGQDKESRFQRSQTLHRVAGLRYKPDRLVVTLGDGEVLLDTATGQPVADPSAVRLEDDGFADGVVWSGRKRPRYLERDVLLLDEATGDLAWSRRVDSAIRAAALTGDGERLAVLQEDGRLALFDAAGEPVAAPDTGPVVAMTTLPRERRLLVLGRDGGLAIHDLSGQAEPVRFQGPRPPAWPIVAVDGAGRTAVVAGGRRATVYALGEGISRECTWAAPPPTWLLAVAPDGQRVATSDGVDVNVFERCGAPRARVLLLPERQAITTSPDDAYYRTDAAGGSWIRFRRGLEGFSGQEPELPGLVKERSSRDLPL